jgi:hypothetical protein
MALPISTVSIMTDNRLNSQRIRFWVMVKDEKYLSFP